MNDYFGGFDGDFDDGDFDGGFDDDNDDGFNETFSESEMDDETDEPNVPANDPCSGIQWQDWMLIGPISEEIAKEKAEQERLLRENDKDSENED